jgi:4-aminobutyrate aminotransferase
MPSVYYAKYPDLYHSVVPMTDGKCPEFYMNQFKEMFDTIVDPYSVAGIMMEPEQGEGGYIVPPVEFVTFMRELCDKYGIMLIFDEVQCGNGRTGKLYCQEHFGVRPDIFSTAKGIGAGFPLGAVIGKKDVMEKWLPGAHGGTFGGNPVACAAGLASLKILLGGALDNAAKMGAYFKGQLLELQKKYPVIGDVRGLGLMLGIELVQNGKEPNADMTRRVIEASLAKGLMLINCGTYHNTIRFIPPCTVTKEEIDEAVTILDAAFKECMDKR